jgi:hypothetical protein
MSETEGKAAMVAATERGKRRSFNKNDEVSSRKVFMKSAKSGANGMSDIEGSELDWQWVARVAVSERGQRPSFNDERCSSNPFSRPTPITPDTNAGCKMALETHAPFQ